MAMRPGILMITPPPGAIGGMATVSNQLLDLDLEEFGRCVAFPMTTRNRPSEPVVARVGRHAMHLRRLSRAIRRHRTGIVHLHTCSGFSFYRSVCDMLTARRCGSRTIMHVHGAAFDEFHHQGGRVRRSLIRSGLERADVVIALSRRWKDKLIDMSPRSQIRVLENAVPIPAVPRRRDGGHDRPCRFLLLARMDMWKGIDDLLDACTVLRERRIAYRMTLAGPAGSAGNAHTLPHKIAGLGLTGTVEYVGRVVGDDKQRLMDACDVYVQPSHHEGMPMAVLEAMATGLPVVATRVGSLPEVITDGVHGVLVPPQAPRRLAEAMAATALDAARRRSMSVSARAIVESRFSLSHYRTQLVDIYRSL